MRIVMRVGLALVGLVVVVGGFLWVRSAQALRALDVNWAQTQIAPLEEIGYTARLEILPLIDAAAGRDDLGAERGVSYLIRTDETTLLLDFGMNLDGQVPSLLEQNMAALGVSLDDIDIIAVSHNHPDHVGGMGWWRQGTFSFGAEQIDLGTRPVYLPEEMAYPGVEPVALADPAIIAPGVATTGTIEFPEVSVLAALRPTNWEQSLIVNVAGVGPVVITGCGHPGVEKIITRAEAVTGAPVAGLIGGLHYGDATAEELQPEIDFLAQRDLTVIAVSPHDSLPAAVAAFQAAFPEVYRAIEVGTTIVIEGPSAS